MRRRTTTLAAAALLLAACGSSPDDGEQTAAPGQDVAEEDATEEDATEEDAADEDAGEPEAGDPDASGSDGDTSAEDLLASLPDLESMVDDGTFRGEGIVLPIPDGWGFEPAALLQGQVLASAGDAGLQQIAGQAVDVEDLAEPITYEELLESNRDQFPEEPSVDEDIELDGAVRAHQLRYDALPADQEGLPEVSLVLLVADDGDGRLAFFNYAAATDEFEDANAEQLLAVAGFDPSSDPTPLALPDVGTPEPDATEPDPTEPDPTEPGPTEPAS